MAASSSIVGGARRDLSPRRVVVKIGSAVLARAGQLDPAAISRLATDLSTCRSLMSSRGGKDAAECGLVVVSSGAVASGYRALGLAKPPKDIMHKQAAAAVGQPRLMSAWASAFASTATAPVVAQVLLTAEDIDHRTRFLNARRTLQALLEAGTVPIINENDSVSYAEIKLGDNDHLSSLVASLVDAELLIILSSVAGVWDISSPQHKSSRPVIVPEVRSLAQGLSYIDSSISDVGTGGMQTKIKAACTAAALGTGVIIADGTLPNIVQRLLDGEAIGTYFPPAPRSGASAARKRWIGFSARPKGTVVVDDGARRAVVERGASLLPSGITEVRGEFDVGALVELATTTGSFARGLSLYSSDDLRMIRGRKSADVAARLGTAYADEAIHRDDLVIVDADGLPQPVNARTHRKPGP